MAKLDRMVVSALLNDPELCRFKSAREFRIGTAEFIRPVVGRGRWELVVGEIGFLPLSWSTHQMIEAARLLGWRGVIRESSDE